MKFLLFISFIISEYGLSSTTSSDKSNFVLINHMDPSLLFDIRYFGTNNFLGEKVDGYEAPHCYLAKEAAGALKRAQKEALKSGLTLKIFDCYRPQMGVDHFVRWAKDSSNNIMKKYYYPNIDKKDLFKLGYIASKSSHSRGSTIDLTLSNLKTGKELDMGTSYDFFSPRSHTLSEAISKKQMKNRMTLKNIMELANFKNYSKEWWHYSLNNEPYPETYYNYLVE